VRKISDINFIKNQNTRFMFNNAFLNIVLFMR